MQKIKGCEHMLNALYVFGLKEGLKRRTADSTARQSTVHDSWERIPVAERSMNLQLPRYCSCGTVATIPPWRVFF